jgi:hypothetical protein
MVIPMVIQTILLDPSGPVWTDAAPNVSRQDPTSAVRVDAEHPARNRKVEGSNPSSGSTKTQLRAYPWTAVRIVTCPAVILGSLAVSGIYTHGVSAADRAAAEHMGRLLDEE